MTFVLAWLLYACSNLELEECLVDPDWFVYLFELGDEQGVHHRHCLLFHPTQKYVHKTEDLDKFIC
jgi:hypothetical protein